MKVLIIPGKRQNSIIHYPQFTNHEVIISQADYYTGNRLLTYIQTMAIKNNCQVTIINKFPDVWSNLQVALKLRILLDQFSVVAVINNTTSHGAESMVQGIPVIPKDITIGKSNHPFKTISIEDNLCFDL